MEIILAKVKRVYNARKIDFLALDLCREAIKVARKNAVTYNQKP